MRILSVPLLLLGMIAPRMLVAEDTVDFDRDIRPILSKHCLACHGTDEKSREAGLRLDVLDGAMLKLESGKRAIVPRDSGHSELIARITTKDEDEVMPPVDEGKPLSPEDVETLRRWIDQGAVWAQHWSYNRIQRPAVPKVKDAKWAVNDIDRFVLAGLEKAGLEPMPKADRYKLLRRLSLDSNDDDMTATAGDRVTLTTLHGAKGLEFPVVFLIGAEPGHLVGDSAVFDLAVRRAQEAILIDSAKDGEATDETNVGAFRSLDRAEATVVRGVNVTNFEARALTVESTWA